MPPPPCPLPHQIIAANTDAPFGGCRAGQGHDTITLDGDITLDTPLPAINSYITIEGNGHTISGANEYRIFDVKGGQLTVNNLTMTEGSDLKEGGGAIRLLRGEAIINNSRFIKNRGRSGGAIAVGSTGSSSQKLTVNKSSFESNQSLETGGAIAMSGGTSAITNSSFVANTASQAGGAIRIYGPSRIDVSNSTFISNRGGWNGGALAIEWRASATVTHVTMLRNYARDGGGNAIRIYDNSGSVSLRNSIIAGGRFGNCIGKLTQNVGNLIQYGSCAAKLTQDPVLGDPTGSPAYVPLQPGSPAIDAADARFCLDMDQIGTHRPLGAGCDIGAFEAMPVSKELLGCGVTTSYVLNFRDGPGGNHVGRVPENATLVAIARTPGWFKVDFEGALGWISADYVVQQGNCA